MAKKAKAAKRTDGKKEVLVQGKHQAQLLQLQQRQAQIKNQQDQLVLALHQTRGGVQAILDFYASPNEAVVDYDSQRGILLLEKKPAPPEPKEPVK